MQRHECRSDDAKVPATPVKSRLLDVRGPIITPTAHPNTTTEAHQIEQFSVDKQGLWINDLVSVHMHLSDSVGNETRLQTRQRASSQSTVQQVLLAQVRGV
ncbi:hypothetical protein AVEN_155924-1 [Araneus ventricosus]|uniref:Uncharacterized protein n=1 Tax=Araneus ventricosus TaxID=182803 RepID=A0A4Y2M0J2_ARAVE|nr:hypothetical protein AVEN_155924-1 [Araneus ventricosus]